MMLSALLFNVLNGLLIGGSLTPSGKFTANVMAPLTIGDIAHPDAQASQSAWTQFQRDLDLMKSLGAYAVSTDVWWGAVEGRADGEFDWRYYDRLSDAIVHAGLKWVPILSFHQCGGNVGDACNIPIPAWIWKKYVGRPGIENGNDLKYESEEGHLSQEVVSAWGTPYVVADYTAFMEAFQAHFAARRADIAELNISLGPSGELRYPSYDAHDPDAGYPTRGRLQAYSRLAVDNFKAYLRALGLPYNGNDSFPPNDGSASKAQTFFDKHEQFSVYGQRFFDWYNSSLLLHGETLLTAAIDVFDRPDSPFRGIPLGAKVPGVHWRAAIDRSPELAAGLIRTSDGDLDQAQSGHGYRNTLSLFSRVRSIQNAPTITLHFTCLEMDDGDGGSNVGSLAKSLVHWVADQAHRMGVPIKGENALSGAVFSDHAWDNLNEAIDQAGYEGLTVLRMTDIRQSAVGQKRFAALAATHNH